MSRIMKKPYIQTDELLNIIGDYAGHQWESDFFRTTYSLRFPLNFDNGNFKQHIRIQVVKQTRDFQDEPWSLFEDRTLVKILADAVKYNYSQLHTRRMIELSWRVLRKKSWVAVRLQQSKSLQDLLGMEYNLERPEITTGYVGMYRTNDPNEFYGLTSSTRQELLRMILKHKQGYIDSVHNYHIVI